MKIERDEHRTSHFTSLLVNKKQEEGGGACKERKGKGEGKASYKAKQRKAQTLQGLALVSSIVNNNFFAVCYHLTYFYLLI